MSIDEPTLIERPFTDTHDRILHALVERVHDMSLRIEALEIAQGHRVLVPPEIPGVRKATSTTTTADRPACQSKAERSTGWQPARR